MSTTTPITIEQPPALDHDAMMLARFGTKVGPRQKLERRIVWNLLRHLERAGFTVCSMHDGDEVVDVKDAKAAMELVFNLDEAWLHVRKPAKRSHVIAIVLGNGVDCISDWNYFRDDSDGFNAAMDAFDAEHYA
jgi:hypothetical protein